MTNAPGPESPNKAVGCLLTGALSGVVTLLGWFVVMALYVFLIEERQLMPVRRDFGYDIALIYAPIFALASGGIAAWWASQRGSRVRMLLLVGLAAIGALLMLLFLFGFGMFY